MGNREVHMQRPQSVWNHKRTILACFSGDHWTHIHNKNHAGVPHNGGYGNAPGPRLPRALYVGRPSGDGTPKAKDSKQKTRQNTTKKRYTRPKQKHKRYTHKKLDPFLALGTQSEEDLGSPLTCLPESVFRGKPRAVRQIDNPCRFEVSPK